MCTYQEYFTICEVVKRFSGSSVWSVICPTINDLIDCKPVASRPRLPGPGNPVTALPLEAQVYCSTAMLIGARLILVDPFPCAIGVFVPPSLLSLEAVRILTIREGSNATSTFWEKRRCGGIRSVQSRKRKNVIPALGRHTLGSTWNLDFDGSALRGQPQSFQRRWFKIS